MPLQTESYTRRLTAELKSNPPERKGERTRRRLQLAAARVLERNGFHGLRVGDITSEADASDGSFYIYFKDKKQVTLSVLEDFLTSAPLGTESGGTRHDGPFEAIREANLLWIRHVRANAGLMRCVFQVSDEDTEFSRLVHSTNRTWYERVARSVVRNHAVVAVEPDAALFAAWTLGSMTDELLRRIVVYPDPNLVGFLGKTATDDEALATAVAVVWYRVLYPDWPLPAGLDGLALDLAAFSGPARTDRRSAAAD
jgi:AcrR family transcriptional regulator